MNSPQPYLDYERQMQQPAAPNPALMQAAQLARVAITPGHVLAGGVILLGGVWVFYKTFRGQIKDNQADKKRQAAVEQITTNTNAQAADLFLAAMGMASNTGFIWNRIGGGNFEQAKQAAQLTQSFAETAGFYRDRVGNSWFGYGDLNADLQTFFDAKQYGELQRIIQSNAQKGIKGLPIQLS